MQFVIKNFSLSFYRLRIDTILFRLCYELNWISQNEINPISFQIIYEAYFAVWFWFIHLSPGVRQPRYPLALFVCLIPFMTFIITERDQCSWNWQPVTPFTLTTDAVIACSHEHAGRHLLQSMTTTDDISHSTLIRGRLLCLVCA